MRRFVVCLVAFATVACSGVLPARARDPSFEERVTAQEVIERVYYELYAALGNDPFLVKEYLARAALVDGTSRPWSGRGGDA